MRRILTALFAALTFTACCKTGIEGQESSYEYRKGELAELENEATGGTKDDIRKRREDIEKRYASLPTDEAGRGEGLGKLNKELSAANSEFEKRVEAERDAKENASRAAMIKELEGTWTGGGVTLSIDGGGSVSYEKKSGNSSKSFNGSISKADESSFEAGALGMTTKFKIDKRPYDDGGARKMVVDGTELVRK